MRKRLSTNAHAIALAVSASAALSMGAYAQEAVEAEAASTRIATSSNGKGQDAPIEDLDAPLYSPFTARYLLDEVRSMRVDLERTRAELIQRQIDREYQIATNATSQSQRAVELFFYLITGVTGLLVFVGWNSLRNLQSRIGKVAEGRVDGLVQGYAERLDAIEAELKQKSQYLKETQRDIDLTNEVHSLWLRASQETTPAAKISVYDEIMKLRPEDTEAMTYKASAALELGEPQWAISLANRVLDQEPDNAYALYQRACAYASTGLFDEALADLGAAIAQTESFREEARGESAFEALRETEAFEDLTRPQVPAE